MTRSATAAPRALLALVGVLAGGPAVVHAEDAKKAEAPAQKAAAALQKVGTPAAPAAKPAAPEAAPAGPEVNVEQRLDLALEHHYAHRHALAAAALYDLYRGLPEADLKRDTVAFYLAESLSALGLAQGAIEHHIDIVTGRRTPDLVLRSLVALDQLVRARLLDDARLIDQVLFGTQFGDLPPETAEFVDYHQGLGELRRGFGALGARRLEELAVSSGYYGWKSRYALAVDRLMAQSDEEAEKSLRAIAGDGKAPRDVRNDARTALARMLYEQKKYAEAFDVYAENDAPLTAQDVILVEKAWAKVGARDEQRALGQVVGLGAPVYRLAFSPERFLIRAASLDRLCQFRAAHLAVGDFRHTFDDAVRLIRQRKPLGDSPVLRLAAQARVDLLPGAGWRTRLESEKAQLAAVRDKNLRTHLEVIYAARLAQANATIARSLDHALEVVADELLAVDEQMTILDYEIGVGLFKGVAGENRDRVGKKLAPIPPGGEQVYYRFHGEYWSDEIADFEVRAEDRCLR